jgi:SecD/SecF fusion protein
MQNKSAIWIFTILLAIATLYSISLSFVSSSYESEAENYAKLHEDSLKSVGYTGPRLDSAIRVMKRKFLRDSSNAEVYPVLGLTYQEVKENELNLGLDLQGGMSVTLEVSVPELVLKLADYSENPQFREALSTAKDRQKNSQAPFLDLFQEEWNAMENDLDLWRIFNNIETGDKFPPGTANEEVFNILREEAKAAINNTENIIRKRIDRFGVAQPLVQKQQFSGRILVELPGVDDRERVRATLKSTANLEFWETYINNPIVTQLVSVNEMLARERYPDAFDTTATDTAAIDSLDTDDVAMESDSLANDTTESDLDLSSDDEDLDLSQDGETEGETDEMSAEQKKRSFFFAAAPHSLLKAEIQGGSPVVGWANSADTAEVNKFINKKEVKGALPADLRLMWAAKEDSRNYLGKPLYALYAIKDESGRGKPKLDGESITDASTQFDQFGQVAVSMSMNPEGTRIWREMTEAAAPDNHIAIVMDNLVYSAPQVNEPIPNGSSQITLGGTQSREQQMQEADDLTNLLKAGALPAPATIVDETIVGPSLGADNINSGLMSFAIALLVVLLYMIFYYKGAGLISDIALIANLFFLVGALASLHAALTLPGIAGIVLTIGMAVDANVLIYERIREEMRLGKGITLAIKDGYNKAYSAIVDANITTLLTAIILFSFGSGAIKGFATVLIIGIFTSLFSAIVITRLIFDHRLKNKKPISFASSITKNWFTKINFDFLGKRKIFYAISGIIILIGVISLSTKGLNMGLDFKGGRSYTVEFEKPITLKDLRSELNDNFTREDGSKGNPEVKYLGTSGQQVKITTSYLIESDDENADSMVRDAMISGLSVVGIDYNIIAEAKVDPTISDDFRTEATYATIFTLLVVFLYIFFRFRKWQFGLGALIALTHDVLIVLSLFSIFYGILPFSLEVDQAFIAAILTVIGYSINDTVVVFDRIREFLAGHKSSDQKVVVNDALNQTLSRTINTSMSTFVVLLTIFLFGGETIRGFAFALMIGVVVGTYSSLFVASPIVVDFTKQLLDKNKKD